MKQLLTVFDNKDSDYDDMFKQCNILPFKYMVKLHDCAIIHRIVNGTAPSYINGIIKMDLIIL